MQTTLRKTIKKLLFKTVKNGVGRINYAFAVKPTNSDRGEYVNARFTGSSGVYEEWYQIADGKLISWHQTKRTLAAE